MARAILGVIVGYVAMAALVFITFTLAYLAMGADGAFKPGTYDVTALWLAVSFALSVVGALLGGFVCAAVAKGPKAPVALVGIVFVLGLVFAVATVMAPEDPTPKVRQGDVGNLEAMQGAKQPVWVAFLNPLIGTAGVLAGVRLKRRGGGSPTQE